MNKIKCIAIDDEPLALEVIKNHSEKIIFVELKATFTNPLEALLYLQENEVDLILLDILMPELNGLKFPQFLKNLPDIIFVTAYADHALQSYDLNAIDYLLKPVSFDRFLKAINKVDINKKKNYGHENVTLLDIKTLFVRSEKKIIQVQVNKILYIEGLKDYVLIYTHDDRIITRESIKKILLLLEPYGFIQVHKSFIVSIEKIKVIDGSMLKMNDIEIPIGKSFKQALYDKLKNTLIGIRNEDKP